MKIENKSSNEIRLTRIYSATIQEIWDAWDDPNKLTQWWGPRGFSTTTKHKNMTVGGDWLFTMHGPDGTNHPNYTKFIEVEKYKKLYYAHGTFPDKEPLFHVRVIFEELNQKTLMKFAMILPNVETADKFRVYIKQAGGDATWDRLAEFLEQEKSKKDIFVISRSFNANCDQVFDAWTNAKKVMLWTAPTGFEGHYIHANIVTGGESFYCMTGNGVTMYGKANYLDIQKNQSLIYTQKFVDKDGQTSRHPMAPTWPESMKTSVSFIKVDENETLVRVQWEVFGDATIEERATFNGAKAGMTQGWTGSFDKLDEFLK